MANSNETLEIKINRIIQNVEKLQDDAGELLVKNIKAEAKKSFGNGSSGYPYDFHDSFQRDDVVYYDKQEKVVIVQHPAAKVLEYGIGSKTIVAKNGKALRFKGKDGEDVFAKSVTIKPKKPVGYAKAAIKETINNLKNKEGYKGGIL